MKERVKTFAIAALLVLSIILTYNLWFNSGILDAANASFSLSDLPFVRYFAERGRVSVPKENLSYPRKIVINDGSLWVPYYNTDDAFYTLDERTSEIIAACLAGEAESESIDYETWLAELEKPSVYVEYPITVTPEMLAVILGTEAARVPSGIELIKDAIVTPGGDNESVTVSVRDAETNKAVRFTLDDERYSFSESVLAVYVDKYRREGYYEFAFSTLLGDTSMGESGVTVDDLVLFSDSDAAESNVIATNPLTRDKYGDLLQSFSFASQPLRHRREENYESYVENYATVTIYDDGLAEYSAVVPEKGIYLTDAEKSEYEVLNSAIDFAERVWSSVSDETLNVLVTGIEIDGDVSCYTLDYYVGGREVAVAICPEDGEALYHAIEIVVQGGRIISYRQYMRLYEKASSESSKENFVTALDYFVLQLSDESEAKITDLYPGYYDDGKRQVLQITWLAKVESREERLAMD